MFTRTGTKLRLVRCPRCRKILPEWPGISVYKCGACDAILQAKDRKNDINGTESICHGNNLLPKNENESVSDRMNQDATVPSSESSPVSDNKGDQSESGNHNTGELHDSITSEKLPASTKLCSYRNDRLCLDVKDSDEQGKHKSSVDHDARKHGNMSLDLNNGPSRERTSFDELHCSYEPSLHENDDEHLEHDENRLLLKNTAGGCQGAHSGKATGERKLVAEVATLTQLTCHTESSSLGGSRCDHLDTGNVLKPYIRQEQNEGADHGCENLEKNAYLARVSLPSENIHYQTELSTGGSADIKVVESRYLPEQRKGTSPHKYTGRTRVSSGQVSFSVEASSSAVVASNEVKTSSMVEQAREDVDEYRMSSFKSLDIEGSLSAKKVKSVVAAESPPSESMLPENLSPNNKRLQQSCDEVQGIGRVRSIDTFESLLSPTRGCLSESYYPCDASLSSYEAMDDQLSDQYSDMRDRMFKATSSRYTNELGRKDGFGVKKTLSGELEMYRQSIDSASMFTSKNRNGIAGGDRGLEELPGAISHDNSVRSKTQWDMHESGSRMTYISRSSQFVHGNPRSSNYQHNMSEQDSVLGPPEIASFSEPDNIQLLRMVYELEDKLKQTHICTQTKDSRFSPGHPGKEKHSSIYYDGLQAEEHEYADLRFSGYPGNVNPETGWPQPKVSRMNFSGEAAQPRHHIGCMCSHCCRKNWQCPTQMPTHTIHCSECMAHSSNSGHYGFPSCSWSPQSEISSSSASWSRETEANNRKYMGRELNDLYMEEKQNVVIRHVMPLAAGSPIIACFHCSELLQLPVDFLVSKRGCNQLKCASCNRILKFSLHKGSHLVPFS